MNKNKSKVTAFALLLALTTGCASHYELTNVSRTRILVDSRYDATPHAAANQFIAPFKAKVDSVMSPIVGAVAHDMAAKRPESDLSNLLADILVWAAQEFGEQPAFGVQNMGGIRAALSKGNVRYGDVLDVAPFENKICLLTLTGEKVMELFGQMAHRGGEGVSHGVELVITPDGKLLSARLHGKEIDTKAKYRVVTLDYLAQGNDQLEAFKSGTNLLSPQEERYNTRFIIMNYFREMMAQGKAVDAQVEGRITIKK